MELLLIRHAIAEDRDSSRWPDDSKRPLTDRGRSKFARVASVLADRIAPPESVFSSRYVRAWETAMILAREAGWPEPVAMPELEFASSAKIIAALRSHGNRDRVALVGHQPTLGLFTSAMLTGDEDGMEIAVKKGGVICLEGGSRLRVGEAVLRWYLTPKLAGREDGA